MAERTYDRSMAINYGEHRQNVNHQVVDVLTSKLYEPVIELGCGTGNYLRALETTTGVAVVGLDSSRPMLEQARTKAASNLLIQADLLAKLPFEDSTFGMGYMIDVLHHLVSQSKADKQRLTEAFNEVHRIIDRYGTFVIGTDLPDDIARKIQTQYWPSSYEYDLQRYLDYPTLRSSLLASGFNSVDVLRLQRSYRIDNARIAQYANRTHSALKAVPDDEFVEGLERMRRDVESGKLATWSPTYSVIIASNQ